MATGRSLEDNIGVRLSRLGEVFTRLARLVVEQPHGLRGTELRILNTLDGAESVPINAIARKTHIDKAWISRSVRDLEAKGLVGRRADTGDSRKIHAFLTDPGRALLNEIRPLARAAELRVLAGIDEERLKADLDSVLCNTEAILDNAERVIADRKSEG